MVAITFSFNAWSIGLAVKRSPGFAYFNEGRCLTLQVAWFLVEIDIPYNPHNPISLHKPDNAILISKSVGQIGDSSYGSQV